MKRKPREHCDRTTDRIGIFRELTILEGKSVQKRACVLDGKTVQNDRGILEGFSFQSSARLFIVELEIIACSIFFASFERHGSGLIRPMHVRTLIAPCHKAVNII